MQPNPQHLFVKRHKGDCLRSYYVDWLNYQQEMHYDTRAPRRTRLMAFGRRPMYRFRT
jgi:hypothetical protein